MHECIDSKNNWMESKYLIPTFRLKILPKKIVFNIKSILSGMVNFQTKIFTFTHPFIKRKSIRASAGKRLEPRVGSSDFSY